MGYHFCHLYNGVIPMEQTMNKHTKRLLQKSLQGGLSTYVFFMLGMSIMLYMFGFTNMMGTGLVGDDGYRSTAKLDDDNTSITDPNMQNKQNPLQTMLQSILTFAKDNIGLLVVGGISTVIAIFIGRFVLGANMTVLYQYLIPLAFVIVFLNYLVFPINPGSDELSHMELAPGLSISVVLTIFFNLWFILSIIAYLRNGEL